MIDPLIDRVATTEARNIERMRRIRETAPDLLDALKAMLSSIESADLSNTPGLYDAIPWGKVEAAIRKAEGVQP